MQKNEMTNPLETKLFLGKFQDHLSEFVYGGMDGRITTFMVVAGAESANLPSSAIIIKAVGGI